VAPQPPSADQIKQAVSDLTAKTQGSQAWNSIFRPGSIFRKGYNDSPRVTAATSS